MNSIRRRALIVLLLIPVLVGYSLFAVQSTGLIARGASAAVVAPQVDLVSGDSVRVTCDNQISLQPASGGDVTVFCGSATTLPTATTTAATATSAAATATAIAATVGPTITPGPAQSSIWVTPSELAALPMSGTAWDKLKSTALGSWEGPDLKNLNSNDDVQTLAGALYAMRTGDQTIRTKVAKAIVASIGTEVGSRTLEVSRNIRSYVLAADIINLKTFDPSKDAQWRAFLGPLRTRTFDGRTIVSTQEDRPNNWGSMAGAARIAISRYLDDNTDIAASWIVFQGRMGDREVYSGFSFGELSWQCNPALPVAINPAGCTIQGHDVGGVMPDDQRRSGSFSWPPPNAGYTHESLQGMLRAADLYQRAGFNAFGASNNALLRSEQWLFNNGNVPTGDDVANIFIINHFAGSHFQTDPSATTGKNGGWEAWVYGP